jgi:hypothetical protein
LPCILLGMGSHPLPFFLMYRVLFLFLSIITKQSTAWFFSSYLKATQVHGQYFNQLERHPTISLHADKQVQEILYFWLGSTCYCEPPLIGGHSLCALTFKFRGGLGGASHSLLTCAYQWLCV